MSPRPLIVISLEPYGLGPPALWQGLSLGCRAAPGVWRAPYLSTAGYEIFKQRSAIAEYVGKKIRQR